MPTTTYTDATFGARNIGGRTDSTPSGVTDLSAEEDRYSQIILAAGIVTPTDGYLPASGGAATWDVDFGSGVAKADYAAIEGDVAGQGKYLVRMAAASETVTIDPADGSNPRIDEVYLVVTDGAYDGGSHYLPRFGYRKGDAAASPAAPGPDVAWDAELLLASIAVPSGVADIDACTITDERLGSGVLFGDGTSLRFLDDDAIIDTPTGGIVRLQINGVDEMTVSASTIDAGGNTITNVGLVDGVDVSDHGGQHGASGSDPVNFSPPAAIVIGAGATEGTGGAFVRQDHQHGIGSGTPGTIEPDDSASAGSSGNVARSDHQHAIGTAAAGNIGTANAEGSSSSFARADHTHRIQSAAAVAVVAGENQSDSLQNTSATAADYVTATFTMPAGWATASVTAWGTATFIGKHLSNNAAVRIEIGASNGTQMDLDRGSNLHVISGAHAATVSGTSTIALAVLGPEQSNGGADALNGNLAFIATRLT